MSSTAATVRLAARPAASRPAAVVNTARVRPSRPVAAPAARPRTASGVHLTGRGYLVVLATLLLLLFAAFAVGRAGSSRATELSAGPAPAPTQVTVQQGDTLWSIARQVAPERDPRDVVAQIRRLNHLPSASLQARRQLLLPEVV